MALRYRRALPFSPAYLLERVWIRKRAKWAHLLADLPGVSPAVVWRSLAALERAGMVRARRLPSRGRNGRPGRAWRVTERGLDALAILEPYRDVWAHLRPGEMVVLGAARLLLERLEARRRVLFPDVRENIRAWNYFSERARWPGAA